MHSRVPVYAKKEKDGKLTPHKLCSVVYASIESACMSFLIDCIGYLNMGMVPLATQHDGLTLISQFKLTEAAIARFNRRFSELLMEQMGLSIPVEFKEYE